MDWKAPRPYTIALLARNGTVITMIQCPYDRGPAADYFSDCVASPPPVRKGSA